MAKNKKTHSKKKKNISSEKTKKSSSEKSSLDSAVNSVSKTVKRTTRRFRRMFSVFGIFKFLKIFIVIILILGILSIFKSCDPGGWKLNLPKIPWPEIDLSELIPDWLHSKNGKETDEGNRGDEVNGENGDEDDGVTHSCDAELISIIGRPATCSEPGYYPYYECSSCGAMLDSERHELSSEDLIIPIDSNAHKYGDFTYIGNNKHEKICILDETHPSMTESCQYSETWMYDAEEHFYKCFCGNTVNNEPHMDDDNDEICDVCNADLVVDGGEGGGDNPEGEEPDNPNLPDEPGCEHIDEDNDGICDGCGGIFGDNSGDSCEHVDNNNDGICDNCDADIKDDSGEPDEPLGPGDSDCIHEWSEWKINSVANCTQGGQQIRTCTKEGCGYTEYAYYSSPLGHEPDEHNICVRCEKVLDGHLHTYSDDGWVIDIEPTCYSYGERHVDCETCSEVIVEKIRMISHTFDADDHCTVCGYHLPSDDFDDVNVNDSTVGNTSIELNGGIFDVLEHRIDMPHVNNGGITEGNVVVYLDQHPAPSPIRMDLLLDSEEFSLVVIIRARFSRPIESGYSLVIRLSDGTEYSPIGDIYGEYEAIFMVELDKNNSYGNQFSLEFDYSGEKGYIEVQELYVDYIYNYSIEGEK